MARPKKKYQEALDIVEGKTPVAMNGFTILVPKHEIERLVREYVNSHVQEGGK